VYEAIALGNPLHMLASFKSPRRFIFAILFENRDFSKTLTHLALKKNQNLAICSLSILATSETNLD
jgi:hypothetical protein